MTTTCSREASPPGSNSSSRPTRDTHSNRRSPSVGLKQSIAGLVHRVRDAISPTRETRDDGRGRSPDRKKHQSSFTGRGGAGNMVTSQSRDRAAAIERDEREHGNRLLRQQADRPHTTGRGGAGNIRSPSRDQEKRARDEAALRRLQAEEKAIEAVYEDKAKSDPISVGRGGAGNIIHQV